MAGGRGLEGDGAVEDMAKTSTGSRAALSANVRRLLDATFAELGGLSVDGADEKAEVRR